VDAPSADCGAWLYSRCTNQIDQIVDILNCHLDSLQWLDKNATMLEHQYVASLAF
jgi:hypothetical protein